MARASFASTQNLNEHAAILMGCTAMELGVIVGGSFIGAVLVSIVVGSVTGYTQMATLGVFFPWAILIALGSLGLGAFKYGKPPGHYLHVIRIWLHEKGFLPTLENPYLLCDGPMGLGRTRQLFIVEDPADEDYDGDDDYEEDEDAER